MRTAATAAQPGDDAHGVRICVALFVAGRRTQLLPALD